MYVINSNQIVEQEFQNKEKPNWDAVIIIFRDKNCSELAVKELNAVLYNTKVLLGM